MKVGDIVYKCCWDYESEQYNLYKLEVKPVNEIYGWYENPDYLFPSSKEAVSAAIMELNV